MSENPRRTVLGNGLRVITKEMRKVPIATFWVWYGVGSRNESAGTTGISHWVEHMMFKGTPNLKKGDIFRTVNANGGILNGFTWLDYTAYFETLPSHRIDLAAGIESDRMANSLFSAEDVDSERTVIISEREGSENSPSFLLGEEMAAAAFQAHPYGHSVIGWKEDLRTMTREDLYQHYRTYYSPNNATVVAVGDLETEAMLDLIRERFESIPRGPEVPRVRAMEPPQRGERRIVVRHPAGVPEFEVTFHSPSVSNPDMFRMMALDAILSGGKPMGLFGARGARMGRSSRLYRALVDGGLASSVGSSLALTRDPYLFGIEATPRPGVSLEEIERAIFKEVDSVKSHGVTRQEMDRAVKQVRAQLVYGSESVTDQGYWLGAMETVSSYELYGQLLTRIEQITPEEVQEVAQRYLAETNRTVGWLIPSESQGAGATVAEGQKAGQAYFYSHPGRNESGQLPGHENTGEVPPSSDLISSSAGGLPVFSTSGGAPGIAMNVERRQLSNGIVLLANQDTTSPQVVIRGSLPAGSLFDTPESCGIARFVAPMLIRGTEVRTFQQLSEETDSLGMALNVDSGRLNAQVSVRCLKEDFPRAVELLAEVLRRPTFPEEEVERLRGQIITGLKDQETSARAVAERRFLEEIYPAGHPYHLWPSGTQDTIGALSREDLQGFYRRHYRPEGMILAIVGDVDPGEALRQVERVLGDWRVEGSAPVVDISPVPLPGKATLRQPVPGKFQSELVMGLPALSREDPDYYAMRLGNLILGELGLSGRLGADIRERQGLAYHVSSDLQASRGPSPWAIRAGVNPANVEKAIDAALHEIELWRSELVSPEELEDGKSFLTGSLPIAMETADGVARTLLDIEYYGLGLDYLLRYPGLINGVTAEEIRSAVQKWVVPEHLVAVIAGPPLPA